MVESRAHSGVKGHCASGGGSILDRMWKLEERLANPHKVELEEQTKEVAEAESARIYSILTSCTSFKYFPEGRSLGVMATNFQTTFSSCLSLACPWATLKLILGRVYKSVQCPQGVFLEQDKRIIIILFLPRSRTKLWKVSRKKMAADLFSGKCQNNKEGIVIALCLAY